MDSSTKGEDTDQPGWVPNFLVFTLTQEDPSTPVTVRTSDLTATPTRAPLSESHPSRCPLAQDGGGPLIEVSEIRLTGQSSTAGLHLADLIPRRRNYLLVVIDGPPSPLNPGRCIGTRNTS